MAKKNIGSILSQLKKSDRFEQRQVDVSSDDRVRPTSFGVPLTQTADGLFTIDMSGVQTFSGITEFIKMLTTRFFETARTGATDLHIEQSVNAEITPELAALNVSYLALQARCGIVRRISTSPDAFSHVLRIALGAMQSRHVRQTLFGDSGNDPMAWVFPFEKGTSLEDCFVLLEYEVSGRFLRLTAESKDSNRLFLKRIPHRNASELDRGFYLQDVHTLAEKLVIGIHHACQNQRESFTEEASHQPAVFELLSTSGLSDLSAIRSSWNNRNMTSFLLGRDPAIQEMIAKTLILLEDEVVLKTIAQFNMVKMITDGRRVYLDLSRRGACLNVALDQRRVPPDLSSYLKRMPQLNQLIQENGDAMKGVRVVFIHHLTAETLGCIRGLQDAGCAHLHGLFIRYKGITPDSYLDALFSLPSEQFIFHSLYNLGDEESLTGHFVLSQQFSPIGMLGQLPDMLRQTPRDYFAAMRLTSGNILFRQFLLAKREGQQVLLIEDGGYMAPLVNIWAQQELLVSEAVEKCGISIEEAEEILPGHSFEVPLREWLQDVFPASIEHTRNGYDQLAKVKRVYGSLVFRAYTMALSDYKNIEEGRGAAMSVLMACEEVMNGQGASMYYRSGLVIGSRGNIGRFLLSHLDARLAPKQCCGVDVVVEDSGKALLCDAPEYTRFRDIPDDLLLDLDLIIGITGLSILQPEDMQQLLLRGSKQKIYLVSGSTKNLEFAAVIKWLQEVRVAAHPMIGDCPVSIETAPMIDPLTETSQGTRLRVSFISDNQPAGVTGDAPYKDILLLADGMPLNFNFFGVPSEIIDRVMQQLIQMSLLGVKQAGLDEPPAADLYALDCNINDKGEPIDGHVLP